MSAFSPSNAASSTTSNVTYGAQGTFSGAYNNSSSPVFSLAFGSSSATGSTAANPAVSQPTSYTPLASVSSGATGFSQYYIYIFIIIIIIAGFLIYRHYKK